LTRMKLLLLLFALCTLALAQEEPDCVVGDFDKVDCGFVGSDATSCEASSCCWVPVEDPSGNNPPWCFYPAGEGGGPEVCEAINYVGDGPGFAQADFDNMKERYKSQLNILGPDGTGTGAVVASPDLETPGGSYFYHWMRDGALSIKDWMDINNNVLADVRGEIDPYVDWVEVVQHKPNPNGIDARCEPKFYIETMEPYDGGWCRPQNDGPALRSMALCKYGTLLLDNNEDDAYIRRVWDIVTFDLEWVMDNWDTEGCDLWEEVRSDDFYFNRMAYVYSLNEVAKFADLIGENGQIYRDKADEIAPTAAAHYTGSYIYESLNRKQDGAVLHSIATFGEYLFPPESEEAAQTIDYLAKVFCTEYPVNQELIAAGEPGVLIGRYPGDSYAGGNPWSLLTAVTGEVFYKAGEATLAKIKAAGGTAKALDVKANKNWMKLLKLRQGADQLDLARAQISAGDSILSQLYSRVSPEDGRVDEQIDKFTGVQTAAESLTWSYANVLHALWTRQNAEKLRAEVEKMMM